jgi:hypothetical protein
MFVLSVQEGVCVPVPVQVDWPCKMTECAPLYVTCEVHVVKAHDGTFTIVPSTVTLLKAV